MARNLKKFGKRLAEIICHRRTRKIAIWCLAILVTIEIILAVAPPLLRNKIAAVLSDTLHRQVSIEEIWVNPLSMTATVRGFVVKERQSLSTAVSFDELYVNLQLQTLFRLGPVIRELRLVKPYVSLVRNEDLTYNFQDLIDEFTAGPKDPAAPTPRFALYNIQILDGKIDFDDRPERTQHTISSLRIGVPFISSLPAHIDITVKPALSAVINGSPLEIAGDTHPFKDSLETNLQLDLTNLDVPKYLAYSPVEMNFTVPSGVINGRLTASFTNFRDRPPLLVIAGNLALRGLVLNEAGNTPLLKLPFLEVDIGALDVFANKATITTAKVQELELHLKQERNGQWNVASLVKTSPESPPAEPKEEAKPFIYQINDFLLEGGKLYFIDEAPARPYRNTLTNVRLTAKNFTNEKAKKSDVELSFETESKEQLTYSASLQLDPLLIDAKFDLKGFRLAPLEPYYEHALNLEIRKGLLDLNGGHGLAYDENGLALRLSGLNADFRDLQIHEAGQAEPLWSISTLQVKNSNIDLNKRTVEIATFESQGAKGALQRESDGTFNYARLAKAKVEAQDQPAKDTSAETPWIITVRQATLDHYEIVFDDKTLARPYRKRLTNVRLTAKDFTNEKEKKSDVELSFESESKERLNYSANVQLDPLLVEGKFDLKGFRLGPLFPYYENVLNLEVRDGLLDLTGEHRIAAGEKELAVSVGNLTAAFRALQLYLAGKTEPLWRIPSLIVKDTNVDVNKRSIAIGAFEGQGGKGSVEREADGTINYARLFKTKAGEEQSKTAEKEPPWQVTARRVDLERFGVVFEDKSLKNPTTLVASDFSWRIENFSNAKGSRSKTTIQARVNDKGTLRLSGSLGILPPVGDLKIEAKEVDLLPFQPYMTDRVNFLLTSGRVGTTGALTFDAAGDGPPKVGYEGKVQISDLATVLKNESGDLLKWKTLDLNDLQFALEPMQLTITDINLREFYSRLILGADGKFNLQHLIAQADENKEEPDSQTAAPQETQQTAAAQNEGESQVTIGKIRFQDGNINFSDFFIKPNYSANLTGVQGSISELRGNAPADMEIQAKLNKGAPVSIGGKINPLAKDLFLDLQANARGIQLSPISPYSAKYVGYGIEKGTLTFNVKYKVDGRKLTADNQIILNQLTFGEKVESPDATKLPVLLAVALMKDRNGVIDVDLPISGSLDDPQFSVGGIVFKVISNIISKAVTAPFALLGAMFGGGADLSHVEFDYGRAALTQSGEMKLKSLATAMNNRPALKLEIAGHVDPVNDPEGLKNVSMERKVKAQKMKDLAGQGKVPKSLEDIRIEKDEYERYLKAAYGEESFPKPRNVIGLAKDLPVSEMEKLILQHTQVSDDGVRELANQRAQIVKDYLLASGQVTADRLLIVASELGQPGGNDKTGAKLSRVDFSLK